VDAELVSLTSNFNLKLAQALSSGSIGVTKLEIEQQISNKRALISI